VFLLVVVQGVVLLPIVGLAVPGYSYVTPTRTYSGQRSPGILRLAWIS
jgi:hypothetical protein